MNRFIDKRNPSFNGNGRIQGSPEEGTDLVPTSDAVRNVAATVKHLYQHPKTPFCKGRSREAPPGPARFSDNKGGMENYRKVYERADEVEPAGALIALGRVYRSLLT